MIDVAKIAAEIETPSGPAPRRHGFPFRDKCCWPVAIVVQAGEGVPLETGRPAPEGVGSTGGTEPLELLELEATFVARSLERAGYDVRRLRSGRYSELRDLLRQQDVVERIVVFHYCGHANGRFLALADDSGAPIPIDARGLSQQLGAAVDTLKLIYVNGCLTDTQDAEFRSVFSNVAFIGNKLEVPDDFALDVATTFYRRFAALKEAGDDRGTARTELAEAWQGTRGEFNAVKNGLIRAAVHADIRDGGFSLAEGEALIADRLIEARSTRSASWSTAYAIAVTALAAVFSYLAHVAPGTSSPAFQAAFSLVPDLEHKDAIERLWESGAADAFRPACDDADRDRLLGTPQPLYGFAVEATRTGAMALMLFMIATLCYRWLPRAHPSLLSSARTRWFAWPEYRLFGAIWLAVVPIVIAYHVFLAPASLGDLSPGANHTWYAARWAFLQCSDALFASFSEVGPFSGIDIAEQAAAGWAGLESRLYLRPYIAYLFYSLIVYLALAIPAMMILSLGILMDAETTRLRLSALRVSIRQASDLARWERAQDRSGETQGEEAFPRRGDPRNEGTLAITERYERELGEIRTSLGRFGTAFALIVLFVLFEILVGRTTTAFFATLMSGLAITIVVLALLRLPRLWRSYRDQSDRLTSLLQDRLDGPDGHRYADALQSINRQPALLVGPQGALIAVAGATLALSVWLLVRGADWTTLFGGPQ
jgi:hypothetical protein